MENNSIFKKVLFAILGTGLLGFFIGFSLIVYFQMTLPSLDKLDEYNPPVPSQILSKDGEVLLEVGKEDREIVTYNEIPKVIIDSFLAAEDDKFFEHGGVDFVGIMRAFYKNFKAGRIVQGGSTITQQVAKTILLNRERSVTRKIRDILLAKKIEEKYNKEEILQLYLNQVYLGGGYYGIKAAFRGYFDKDLSEATVSESSLMAGLLVAPGKYSPYVNPKYAKDRQKYVLRRMRDTNRITEEEYQTALNEHQQFRIRKRNQMKGGHFTDWIRQRVIKVVGEEEFLTNGFKVVTTIDWSLQKIAEEEIVKGLKGIDRRQGYLGPIKNLFDEKELSKNENQEQEKEKLTQAQLIAKEEVEFRKKIFEEASNYFKLLPDGERTYELDISEDNYKDLQLKYSTLEKEIKSKYFKAGNHKDEKLLDMLEEEKIYDAIVTKISDSQRIVYVSLGGARGVIPYEGFRWAHKREINEDRGYFQDIQIPSRVFKTGDIIQIEIKNKNEKLWNLLWSNYKKGLKNKELKSALRKEVFLSCELSQNPIVEGALISISPKTGEIISFVGGKDFGQSQFNRAIQSLRQPGSSVKPLLYAAALENGYTPATILYDTPESLSGVDQSLNWKPRNYDNKFKGPITFRKSLEASRNVPTVKLAMSLGVDTIFDFFQRLEFTGKMDKDLSISLGSFGVTLIDLVKAYAVFANMGKKVIPKSIVSVTDRTGKEYPLNSFDYFSNDSEEGKEEPKDQKEEEIVEKVAKSTESTEPTDTTSTSTDTENDSTKELVENPFLTSLSGDQVYDSRLAFIMTSLLRGIVHNPGGTGRAARGVSAFVGGKTGTTSNYIDAWFVGFSPAVTVGVWTGFDDNKTMGWGETGSKSALPIWAGYMKAALRKFGDYEFTAPKGIVNVLIDPETGKLPKGSDYSGVMEVFVEGTEPGAQDSILVKDNEDESPGDIFEDDEYYNN